MSRRNFLLSAERSNVVKVGLADNFTDKTLLVSFRHVSRYLTGALTCLQTLCKELLGDTESIRFLCSLLVCNKIQIGVGLTLNGKTF